MDLTPQQALNVLAQLAARAMGTAADHEARAAAVEVLAPIVADPEPDP